jgi:hypothetical protein
MAMKHISDVEAVQACIDAREARPSKRAYRLLAERTGQCEKVCFNVLERAYGRGYLECGMSVGTAWATEKGIQMVKDAA